MTYHKLLEKQIKKYLDEEIYLDSKFKNFLEAINSSYNAFEKNKEQYNNINQEYILKQESIHKLYKSLKLLDNNPEALQSEDLEKLLEYFSTQINKKKHIENQLNNQFEFQKLLMKISSEYINIPLEEVEQDINNSLKELAEFVKADRAYIFKYNFPANICTNIFEYCAEGIIPQIDELQEVPLESIPDWVNANKDGKSISIPCVNDLPEGYLKELLEVQDIKSLLVIPLMLHGECIGFVGFDSVKQHYNYDENEKYLLTLFAQVLANVRGRFLMERNFTRTIELLKTLLANLQYGILVEDEKRKTLFTNQLFCELFKIPISPNHLEDIDCSHTAEDAKSLFVDEDNFPKRIHKIIQQKKIVTDELIETKDGKFFERDYIPIYIKGKYKGHLWKYNNVTTTVISQNLLKQSEEKNRLIMNFAINAIIHTNNEKRITFWNKSAENIFGWKKAEIIGKTLDETILPKIYNTTDGKIKSNYTPLLNKQFETTALRKSNEEFPIEISIIPIEQDGKNFFCFFIQDISERKRAEENLRIQKEKYRNIIANMNLGLIEIDNNQIIQFVNQSFCNLSGYEMEELIGKNPSDLFLYHKDNIQLFYDQINLRKKGISSYYRIPIKNKRGELKWWVVSGTPNYNEKGVLIGSIEIHLDITEQKNMEEALKKEKENAQEASKAKEIFLANMSHEIRTPLNAIIGFLRELRKQNLSPIQQQFVNNGDNASQHLLSIINNILDISKIEAGEMSLEIKDFSLKDSVDNVINILLPKAIQKNLNLKASFSSEINAVLKGDAMKIEQILYNLVGNSLKFTQYGEILIICSLLENRPNKQKISITISDTGIGMSKKFIQNIYKKFYQEDSSFARKAEGSGLGMAITRELVKLMNGKINIESEKNKGTKIEIILIFNKSMLEKIEIPKLFDQNISLAGTRILLVEDNELNRIVAQNTLNYYDCIVTEAENGKEALKILKTQHFDIILMDIQMSELDGIETTKILRKKYHITTPIIALTANAFKTEVEKCKQAGMDDYVIKPFSEENLIKIIHHYSKTKKNTAEKMQEPCFENLYDLNYIKTLSKGNEDFVKKMITIFINQTENIIPQIDNLFEVKNYTEIANLIHKIKPSIEGMGIYTMSETVKTLEQQAKEIAPDHKALYDQFSLLKKTLLCVIKTLKENEL